MAKQNYKQQVAPKLYKQVALKQTKLQTTTVVRTIYTKPPYKIFTKDSFANKLTRDHYRRK